MLEVFDKSRKKLAILENAFQIEETEKINAISTFSFSLPETDPKNDFCETFNLIKYNNGQTYRIIQKFEEEGEIGYKRYTCEHVIALLIDSIMPDFFSIGNVGVFTRSVIEWILDKQNKKYDHITRTWVIDPLKNANWVLNEWDFSRQFEYGWEKENLLAALFSVATRFVDKYMWVFDTSVYPYRVSLKRIDETRNPDHYIRKGHNRLTLSKMGDSRQICTRLYPFGAGEGVNQLTIADLNNGKLYLQSPQSYINKYGLIERAWIDRRYTHMESLLEAAQAMLNELQEPYVEYETDFIGDCKVGDIVQIVDSIKSIIVEITTYHEEIPRKVVKIANKPKDVAGTVADLADRQRIEMTYSQGATQIYADSIADNGSAKRAVELRITFPTTMININAVLCKIIISAFRAYSGTTASGGTTTSGSSSASTTSSGGLTSTSTSSGGGTSTSTSSGGGTSTSTESGGGTSSTTLSADIALTTTHGSGDYSYRTASTSASDYPESGGPSSGEPHTHYIDHKHTFQEIAFHQHQISVPSHSHNFTISSHTHNFTVSSHTHSFTVNAHTHGMEHTHTIATHTHEITPTIEFFGGASGFALLINGVQKQYFNSTDVEVDITPYLIKDGKIPRGVWHTIGIQPNALARAEISYNVTGFIQSRGDKTV